MINFGAGPAQLPKQVLHAVQEAIVNVDDSGYSLLELPHRSRVFKQILDEANHLARVLWNIPDTHEILWIQGGGRMQFAMLPMNFMNPIGAAGYVDSGHWAHDAMMHAGYYGNVHLLGSSKGDKYSHLPNMELEPTTPLAYIHLTSNNTIYGTQYHSFPQAPYPLVADMSSDIFSRPIDVSAFKMIYAVAQKNIGMAGVTMVIIDKNFANSANNHIPEILSYKAYMQQQSLINTAPVAAIYTSLCYLRYLQSVGMPAIYAANEEKAKRLYAYLDSRDDISIFAQKDRSKMNVCFTFGNEEKNQQLIARAAEKGIVGIEGHRRLGGLRVSMYNGISIDDVQALISVMEENA